MAVAMSGVAFLILSLNLGLADPDDSRMPYWGLALAAVSALIYGLNILNKSGEKTWPRL